MAEIVILDAWTTDQGDPLWGPVAELGELTCHARSNPTEARERIATATHVLTNKVAVDRDLLAAAPRLQYVGVLATGIDHIDLDACRERDIAVANVPGYSTDSVAQLVFAFLLQYFNRVPAHADRVAAGDWQRAPDFCFVDGSIEELSGKVLLVIGQGAIGGAVRRIGEAFGMEVLAGRVPGRPRQADRLELAQALPQADVISLHCPLTDRTHQMVDGDFLNRCRAEAVLVNTGRGGLVHEQALRFALDNGMLAHACIDVLTSEPPPADHPLIGHPRVTITPHIGWATRQARQRLVHITAANIAAFARGHRHNRVD